MARDHNDLLLDETQRDKLVNKYLFFNEKVRLIMNPLRKRLYWENSIHGHTLWRI